jgi:hypothetical protein
MIMTEAMCKGSMKLGTGCRNCSRCAEEIAAMPAQPVQADQWDESVRGQKMSAAAGRVIFKYQMPVLESFTMKLPMGAEILRVEDQGGMFWMWALVRTDVPDEERKFHSFKCGGKIPDGLSLNYVGFCAVFVQMELGLYIFEEVSYGKRS